MKRIIKPLALLVLVGLGVMLLVRPEETLTTLLEWLPSIIILGIVGSIIRWDMRYERKQEKERGE